ncbi:reverse transcriptase domain-containing protein [Tanacetum coccineum]|uniref:Reverse transcriptase domain-containing protein n=1 Tax=Tanacetum coccineum TaxID=301880 RepID=A0ABQ5GMR6_9ASTR
MLLVTQTDTFYNGLTLRHRDTINDATGGTFMQKTSEECYELIENMTAHHNHWDTSTTRDETSRTISSTTTTESPEVCPVVDGYTQEAAYATTESYPPPEVVLLMNGLNDSTLLLLPPLPPRKKKKRKRWGTETEATKDKVQTTSLESTAHVQPLVVQVPIPEPEVAPKPNPKPSIPYPSRLNDQKLREKANNQMLKFLQIFQKLHFDISFADALLHMPKFASTFKSLLSNKEKLFELANTPLNENCSAVLLKQLPKKLGDPGKFLIPCDFPELDECLALADLGASINLMPLSVWKKLSLPELTPTRMTLELADRSVAHPKGVAEDVFVKVGKFYFPADFVVVDYDVDPRVPLILGRPSLRTERALIDVHGEELTLQVNDEAIMSITQEVSRNFGVVQQVLIPLFFRSYHCYLLPPSFTTPFKGEIVFWREFKSCLSSDSIPSGIDDADFDPEGDIRLLEKLLNDDISSPLPPKELNFEELKTIKSSIDDPPELELKDL